MFTPADWYWLADDGRLYSSARQVVVTTSDAGYRAWDGTATRWPVDGQGAQTVAALQDVLTPYGRFVDPLAYANAKQVLIASGGLTVTLDGVGAVRADTDSASLILLQGATFIASGNPSATFHWAQDTGPLTLTAAQILALYAGVTAFIQATFTSLGTVLTGIASGSITTIAGVDATSWPSNA